MAYIKNVFNAAAIAAAMTLLATAAHADPFTNGDFEQSYVDANGVSQIPAWTYTGNVAIATPVYFGAGSNANDGNGMVAFNAGDQAPNGVLTQTFDTVAGATYAVNFGYGLTSCDGCSQELDASVTGMQGGQLGSLAAVATTSGDLSNYMFMFTADGNSATLSFVDNANNQTISLDGVLDNASVTNVPEPASLALFGLGLLGLRAAGRRRA